jgi:predicted amidohydrolase YtcJ
MIARFALLLLLVSACGPAPVDTILQNGTIYTLAGDQAAPVTAIAITDGVVVATGAEAEALEAKKVIDLDGAWVIPGLVDAHAHLYNLGTVLGRVDLRDTKSAEECIERAQVVEQELPEGAWLRGRSWDQNDWEVTEYPNRQMLDKAFGDRPVYLERIDGHAAWVNSAALRLAGIDVDTADPVGGEILRDADGQATGILIDNAEDLITDVLGDPTPEEIERAFRLGMAEMHRSGMTGVHEMGAPLERIEVLRRGERDGWLDLRLVCYIGGAEELEKYEGGPVRPGPSVRLWIDGVKIYADGALGSRGAALLEDYCDRPGHQGLLIQSPEDLQEYIRLSMERDLTATVHAIGDRGNRVTIDAIIGAHASLGTDRPLADMRPRIEHAQIVHPDDFVRFRDHGIVASVQPTHCTSDMPWAPERLCEHRLEGAYAWRTFLDLEVALPLGSDFPVEKTSAWLGLYAARTRHSVDTGQSWSPEQQLTPLEALLGFTVWPAQAIDAEGWGRLAVGYRADLAVVDHDPLADDAAGLLDTTVELTMVDGKVVYTAEDGRFHAR